MLFKQNKPTGLCGSCNFPATCWWTGKMIVEMADFNIGLQRCRLCALRAQLAYAEKCTLDMLSLEDEIVRLRTLVNRIPELTGEIAAEAAARKESA